MVGMVIGLICFSLPFFLWVIRAYQIASANGTNYNDAIYFILMALLILIGFGFVLRTPFKHYLNHQETRDDVIAVRIIYSGFIIGSLIVIFIFFPIFS